MTSDREIAEKFSILWKQHFPMLTPNFMRVFNESQIQKFGSILVQTLDDVRYDLISEVAFNVAEITYSSKDSLTKILDNSKDLKEIIEQTAKTIWLSNSFSDNDLNLSENEIQQLHKIIKNIFEFINFRKKETVIFKPRLKGYGYISELTADLAIDDSLYEMKTVKRNFKSNDLRQLIIYLALNYVSGVNIWSNAGLFNPRKCIYCHFNVKNLIYNLSGGKYPKEAFEDFLNSLTRDLQVDSNF